jgi:hypothetical protein
MSLPDSATDCPTPALATWHFTLHLQHKALHAVCITTRHSVSDILPVSLSPIHCQSSCPWYNARHTIPDELPVVVPDTLPVILSWYTASHPVPDTLPVVLSLIPLPVILSLIHYQASCPWTTASHPGPDTLPVILSLINCQAWDWLDCVTGSLNDAV